MGFRRGLGNLVAVMLPLLGVSCADDGPVATGVLYNLTCPASPTACGFFPENGTCLGTGGLREILAVNGEVSCDEETPVTVICEGTRRSDGGLLLTLVASVGDRFAFELRGATVDSDGSMVSGACELTIIEDELSYGGDLGACGNEPPSMDQPCRISNVALGGADVSFDVECEALLSDVTGNAFDVGGPNGGPATVRFARCTGF
ncbi:MAG: hypothetical protein OES69_11870 [Myxococcales bacterium]|nr:hypothetical protein [Myxococcales bacterium]MDH3844628.1 hypothetical protein [Myxococcales bacterium]